MTKGGRAGDTRLARRLPDNGARDDAAHLYPKERGR
jgi:hypothetical protein